jgi:hypothetical protein
VRFDDSSVVQIVGVIADVRDGRSTPPRRPSGESAHSVLAPERRDDVRQPGRPACARAASSTLVRSVRAIDDPTAVRSTTSKGMQLFAVVRDRAPNRTIGDRADTLALLLASDQPFGGRPVSHAVGEVGIRIALSAPSTDIARL